jgi:hypothetical protein
MVLVIFFLIIALLLLLLVFRLTTTLGADPQNGDRHGVVPSQSPFFGSVLNPLQGLRANTSRIKSRTRIRKKIRSTMKSKSKISWAGGRMAR